MIDKYKNNTTHISYSEYKKNMKKKSNKDATVFISVFIIGVLIILGFAKILSPNVDVGIADDDEYSQIEEENYDNDTNQNNVDARLKMLQMEDAGKSEDDEEMFSPNLDEKVVLPSRLKKTVGQMEAEMLNTKTQKAEEPIIINNSVQKESKQLEQTPAPSQIINAKVVVGYYATDKQAEVAKSILQEAGIGLNPIVKNMNGYYTLQVGSYSTKEKAQQAANNLLKSNFPARVILE
ncbi:SPOR domain-containing protein [bacterium]|nr:SPOR domain-containing protein [bacterium]